MPNEFYFKIQYFNFDWKLQSHFFAVTDTLNGEKPEVLFRVTICNSPLLSFNSCFNVVHNLNVLQFNHKTYQ